MTPPEKAS